MSCSLGPAKKKIWIIWNSSGQLQVLGQWILVLFKSLAVLVWVLPSDNGLCVSSLFANGIPGSRSQGQERVRQGRGQSRPENGVAHCLRPQVPSEELDQMEIRNFPLKVNREDFSIGSWHPLVSNGLGVQMPHRCWSCQKRPRKNGRSSECDMR